MIIAWPVFYWGETKIIKKKKEERKWRRGGE